MFEEAVRQAIKAEIERAVKIETEKAKAELDARIPQIVAGLAIKVMKYVSVERLRDELVIHIRMEGAL